MRHSHRWILTFGALSPITFTKNAPNIVVDQMGKPKYGEIMFTLATPLAELHAVGPHGNGRKLESGDSIHHEIVDSNNEVSICENGIIKRIVRQS